MSTHSYTCIVLMSDYVKGFSGLWLVERMIRTRPSITKDGANASTRANTLTLALM